ncbi:hypothetical protein M0805_007057 [Coniferiporia weirii]|nr:hypothetical protein M0805_007057 [Coniferiporia weirii]
MLGVQHTRAAATATTTHQHHPSSRAAAASAGPIPAPPKSKKLGGVPALGPPLPSQKAGTLTHSSVNNKSSALHELELTTGTPELGVDDIIAWPDIPREDVDEDDEGTRERDPGRGEEGLVDGEGESRPVLDGASDDARQNAGADGAAHANGAASGSDLHDKTGGEEGADGAEIDVRRMSSPLSELSPAPSNIDDDDREQQDRNTTGQASGPDKSGSAEENPAAEPRAGANVNGNVDPMSGSRRPDRVSPLSAAAVGQSHSAGPSSAAAPSPLTTTYFPSSPSLSQPDRGTLPPSSPGASSQTQLPRTASTPQASSPGRHPPSANAQAGPSRSGTVNGDGVPPPSPHGTFSAKGSASRKGTSIIELNAELFRVCMAFQAQGIAMNAPDAQPFWRKLSSNLTWLAAHVDNTKTTLEVEIPLPDMDAPVLTANAMNMNLPNEALDRIHTLYAQLPVLFAKDIARKERRSSQGPGTPVPSVPSAHPGTPGALSHLRNSATPSLLPPSGIGVKRERSDGRESPAAAKRRDMGESKRSTPAPPGAMLPPATPEHSQHMQRPGSAMGAGMSAGVSPLNPMAGRPMSRGGPMLSPAHSGSSGGDPTSAGGMFATATAMSNASSMPMGGGMPNSQNMQNLQNMQNMRDMQNLAGLQGADAQTRARQMQFRQAMMYQQQQQQHQQHQQHQQQHQHQQQQQQQQQQHQQQQHQQQQQQALQSGQTPMSMSMSPPQAQAQPSQQQIMQAQAAARQMSPPGAQTASGMVGVNNVNMNSMGVNNTGQTQIPLGVPNQAGNMNMAMPGAQAQAGAGTASANAQVLQQIANAGPAAMATYQALQNPQHPMVQYLNQSMPGFSGLPIMEQMRRWQIMQTNMQQRQLNQQNQRNQLMSNQMATGQMRQGNAGVSGSGPSQMQQHGQTPQINMSHQMQQQPLTEGMQFPNAAGMPNRAAGVVGMGMPNQMAGMPNMANMANIANHNPQQRQLYLLQMQQAQQLRSAAAAAGNAGINPAMMTPQMLATAQERARLEQQQRFALAQRQGLPLNPAAASGGTGASSIDQFPPGLRSNPALPGIARSARSPSVSADLSGGTPRIGMRGLPGQVVPGSGAGGNDEYHRALMQAQRNAQMQSFISGTGQGASPGAWPNANSQQQMPLPAGAWPQQSQQGQGTQQNFSMSSSPPAGMRTVELSGTPRQSSATPAPMSQQSPTSMQTPEFDSMMNW